MKRLSIAALLTVLAGPALSLDAAGERYARQMVNGGPISIREAASSIYNTGNTDPATLDVAAEVLAQNYATASGNAEGDAMAWLCKALGKSGNGRYKALVSQAAASGNKKLEKHCGRAAEDLPEATAGSYVVGSVNLAQYKDAGGASAKAAAPAGSGSLADIKPGMSQDEVIALIGPPTSTTSHITGKAFIPFNFKGGDSVRSYGLYKGRGRIVYSKESAYTNTFRVLEVIQDGNEKGYP